MERKDRKASIGVLRVKGTMRGVAVSRTTCDRYGKRTAVAGVFTNKSDFVRFVVENYWGKPTNPNGGDT